MARGIRSESWKANLIPRCCGTEKPPIVCSTSKSHLRVPALKSGDYATTIFLKATSALSVGSVARLTQRLSAIVRGGQLSLEVRLDDFFADSWDYPAILPFVQPLTVPDRFQFLFRGRLSCGQVREREIGCTGFSFHP